MRQSFEEKVRSLQICKGPIVPRCYVAVARQGIPSIYMWTWGRSPGGRRGHIVLHKFWNNIQIPFRNMILKCLCSFVLVEQYELHWRKIHAFNEYFVHTKCNGWEAHQKWGIICHSFYRSKKRGWGGAQRVCRRGSTAVAFFGVRRTTRWTGWTGETRRRNSLHGLTSEESVITWVRC